MSKIIEITLAIAVITVADAIQCNFTYRETDVVSTTPMSTIVFPNEFKKTVLKYDETKNVPFECEDPTLDDFIPVDLGNVDVNTRIDDNDFVQVEDMCHAVKKTIEPKELNNVYNKLKRIAIVQSFSIEECVNEKSNCSKETVPANKRVICKQNYLTIKLMTFDDRNKKFEEPFYYPSTCTCATYMRKSDL